MNFDETTEMWLNLTEQDHGCWIWEYKCFFLIKTNYALLYTPAYIYTCILKNSIRQITFSVKTSLGNRKYCHVIFKHNIYYGDNDGKNDKITNTHRENNVTLSNGTPTSPNITQYVNCTEKLKHHLRRPPLVRPVKSVILGLVRCSGTMRAI